MLNLCDSIWGKCVYTKLDDWSLRVSRYLIVRMLARWYISGWELNRTGFGPYMVCKRVLAEKSYLQRALVTEIQCIVD
jgi:hypothetical protein